MSLDHSGFKDSQPRRAEKACNFIRAVLHHMHLGSDSEGLNSAFVSLARNRSGKVLILRSKSFPSSG